MKDNTNGTSTPEPPITWGPTWYLAWATNGVKVPAPQEDAQSRDDAELPPSPSPAEPCNLTPDDLVPSHELDEARALEALGERKEYNRRMEALFVAGLRRLLECEKEATAANVVADFAYLLDLSPETIKRYLKKYTSRWGPFEMQSEMVRLKG